MNVNALSGIAGGFIQSLISTAVGSLSSPGSATQAGGANLSSLLASSDSAPSLSPFAQLFSSLQQLQQQSPAKYQQVTQQIASNLQSASQTAQASGDSAQATQLAQLATDFKSASTNGQLPSAQDLAAAMGGRHHHHHHYDAAQSGSQSQSTSSNNANDALAQLLSAFQGNAMQSNSLDPASIIRNTLSSAGVGGLSSSSGTGSSLTSN